MRIFISGALNSNSVGFMENVRNMLKLGYQVRKMGLRVYIPCDDVLMSLVCKPLKHEDYYEYDLRELEDCDAILLVPGYETSKGVAGERAQAKEMGIPEFETIDGLKEWLDEEDKL